MALPQAIDIRISMLRLAPQCFAFTSIITYALCKMAEASPNVMNQRNQERRGW